MTSGSAAAALLLVAAGLLAGPPTAALAQIQPTQAARAAPLRAEPPARLAPLRAGPPARPAPLRAEPAAAAGLRAEPLRPVPETAPVPIALPRAVPIVDAASGTLFSALLAIARAEQVDPGAAQRASFEYTRAVQRYRGGDIVGARTAAIQALSIANSAQVTSETPAPAAVPAAVAAPAHLPGLAGGLYGADAPVVDADAFLALARGTIEDCAARRDRRLGGAKQLYAQAQRDFASRNWEATRIDAKAAIDACAKPMS